MIKLLRAARVNKSYIEAVRLHRRNTCEDNTNRPRSHKTSLLYEYRFNVCLGMDLLELSDAAGTRYTVLNMVDMGTTFQQLHVIREGKNATSSQVLKALCDGWIGWAEHPEQLVTDRGLHFRGVLYRYLSGHGVQVHTAPLETPEAIGRVECHGGIVKAMYKKVCAETQCQGIEQVQTVFNELCSIKNTTARQSGFPPSQWVGQNPRGTPSFLNEEAFADLGADIQDQVDPESVFHLQHAARAEARRAYVQLGTVCREQCSRTQVRLK